MKVETELMNDRLNKITVESHDNVGIKICQYSSTEDGWKRQNTFFIMKDEIKKLIRLLKQHL